MVYALPRRWLNRPVDLHSEGYGSMLQYHNTKFFYRRKNKIKSKLHSLQRYTKIELKNEINRAYHQYRGYPCFGLRWDNVNLFEVCRFAGMQSCVQRVVYIGFYVKALYIIFSYSLNLDCLGHLAGSGYWRRKTGHRL